MSLARSQNIDLELLRTFIAVVDNGSITRASKQIHRTQSAISMQIKRLEEQLGQILFDRSGRQLILTYRGKSLVAYARRLLNLHDEAINKLTNDEQKSHITIGCPDDYSATLLPKLMSVLYKKNAKLHITVITHNSGKLRQLLDDDEIDLAILSRLSQSNEGVLISKSYGMWLAKDKASFNQRPLPLALFEPNCIFHSTVIDGLEKGQIDYNLLCDASQTELLISLVRHENFVTVVPEASVPDDLIGFRSIQSLPELPIAEVIICMSGGKQSMLGLSLNTIATQMK